MVSTTGQLDAPLVDIGAVQREYWERKTVELPSLAKFQKPKGWRGWFKKAHTPVCVIRRLNNTEWDTINEKFLDLRTELAKDSVLLQNLMGKMMDGKVLNKEEKTIIAP